VVKITLFDGLVVEITFIDWSMGKISRVDLKITIIDWDGIIDCWIKLTFLIGRINILIGWW